MMPPDPTNVERAVSRTLRDSLERMQRTAKELDQAVADFVAACASNRPANALPSMLRAQTASAALAATLDVLSRFVTSSLQPANRAAGEPVELAAARVAEPEQLDVPERIEESAIALVAPAETAAEAPEPAADVATVEEWPTAPEPTEWSEAHESHDSPVRAEPFEAEPQEPEIQVSDAQHAEAHDVAADDTESLALEPPLDPALEPVVESALSPEISAMPDALEPIATWSAPEKIEEPLPLEAFAGNTATEELVADQDEIVSDGVDADDADGIVGEPELVAEVDQATADEESKIIEEAIAGGIAKMSTLHVAPVESSEPEPVAAAQTFDISLLPEDERELHRRASRVAKVSMQDIKLLQPQQVAIGRENKDICIRLHEEIERAHKEYGRRFKPIMSHPVDYFYDWMVEILAAGDPSALGEYPYQTPALRR
jgi:hypothetical protein